MRRVDGLLSMQPILVTLCPVTRHGMHPWSEFRQAWGHPRLHDDRGVLLVCLRFPGRLATQSTGRDYACGQPHKVSGGILLRIALDSAGRTSTGL